MDEPRSIVEFKTSLDDDGYWLHVWTDGERYADCGPFDTPAERFAAAADLIAMMRSHGAYEIAGSVH